MHDLTDWRNGVVITICLLLAFLGLIPLGRWEAKRWQRFVDAHNCQITTRVESQLKTGFGYGVTGSGKMGTAAVTTLEPGRVAYLCNDGVTYWR